MSTSRRPRPLKMFKTNARISEHNISWHQHCVRSKYPDQERYVADKLKRIMGSGKKTVIFKGFNNNKLINKTTVISTVLEVKFCLFYSHKKYSYRHLYFSCTLEVLIFCMMAIRLNLTSSKLATKSPTSLWVYCETNYSVHVHAYIYHQIKLEIYSWYGYIRKILIFKTKPKGSKS